MISHQNRLNVIYHGNKIKKTTTHDHLIKTKCRINVNSTMMLREYDRVFNKGGTGGQ